MRYVCALSFKVPALALLLAAGLATVVYASSYDWQGDGVERSWHIAENWYDDSGAGGTADDEPTIDDFVVLNSARNAPANAGRAFINGVARSGWTYVGSDSPGSLRLTTGADFQSNIMVVGFSSGGGGDPTGSVNHEDGDARIDPAWGDGPYGGHLSVGGIGGTGLYELKGGSLNLARLFIGHQHYGQNGGVGTFTQTGGTNSVSVWTFYGGDAPDYFLPMSGELRMGILPQSQAVYNLGGTGELSAPFQRIGGEGHATVNHTAGENFAVTTVTADGPTASYVRLFSTGDGSARYNLSGTGTLVCDNLLVDSGAEQFGGLTVFRQTGGQVLAGQVVIGDQVGNNGTYQFDGGVLQIQANEDNEDLVGETLVVGNEGIGLFTVKSGAPGDAITGSVLVVRAAASGIGDVDGFGVLQFDQVVNNGRITARGDGQVRVLDLSGVAAVSNPIDNEAGDTNGWYAFDKGELRLPTLHGTSNTWWWGEDGGMESEDGDGVPDLVNSVRIDVTDDGGGSPDFLIRLLAADHAELPAGTTGTIIGLWDIDATLGQGPWTGLADLTFRYDDNAVFSLERFEEDLRLYHFEDGQWVDLNGILDLEYKTITGVDISTFSPFAVGFELNIQTSGNDQVPEPMTMALLASALVGMGGYIRQRQLRNREDQTA